MVEEQGAGGEERGVRATSGVRRWDGGSDIKEGRAPSASSMAPSKPNILFLLADDMGAWALGCGGIMKCIPPISTN